jgi:hypothetical protein
MYGNRTSLAPPPITSEVTLRIVEEGGRTHRLSPVEIFPKGRQEVAERVMREAFDANMPELRREALQRYLEAVVRRRVPDTGTLTIEGWRTEWIVAPLALPPLDLAGPSARVNIGSFVAKAP